MASDLRRIALSDPLTAFPARFAVGGQSSQAGSGDVKVYEWDSKGRDMGMVGLQTDVGQIRAMAWSSHPHHRSLIATGLTTGRTHLLSLTPSTLSYALQTTTSSNATTPQSSIATLSVKYSRPITSLSFSSADPNYLATGLERHRSDYSLFIWDLSDVVSRLQPSKDEGADWLRPADRLEITNPAYLQPTTRPNEPKHIQQYCQSEIVNSVSFLPSTIYSILASSNNKQIRLFDLRSPSSSNPRPPGQWNTSAVYSLSPDPEQDHSFASYENAVLGTNSKTSVVRVWDTRKPGVEVLNFEVGGGVVELGWMRGSRGRLGVGSRDGGVGIWDVVSGSHVGEDGHLSEWASIGGMKQVVKPRQALHSFALAPSENNQGDVLFVTKDGSINIGPIASPPIIASSPLGDITLASTLLQTLTPTPDQSPTPPNRITSSHQELGSNQELPSPRKNRFQLPTSRISHILEEHGSLSRSRSPSRSRILKGLDGLKLADRSEEVEEEVVVAGMSGDGELDLSGWKRVLGGDVGYIMRRRAEEGYGLDNLLLNAAIASKYPGRARLAGVWEFVHHFLQTMSPETSVYGKYNLTHAGIYQIWTGNLDPLLPHPPTTHGFPSSPSPSIPIPQSDNAPVKQTSAAWSALRSQSNLPSRGNLPPLSQLPSRARGGRYGNVEMVNDAEYDNAVNRINATRSEGEAGASGTGGRSGGHKLPAGTERAGQRRMILAVCGEYGKSWRDEVEMLVDEDQRTKAACWAYFAGDEGLAIKILMNSDDEKHRLMASTTAGAIGQAKSERGSMFWNDSMIRQIDDRYIRAILIRIAGEGEEWEDILEDEVLPLLDRIVLAACNLNDKDLTTWLTRQHTLSLSQGNLTALCLTGFTTSTLPLLTQYLTRTSDLQTVAILSTYIAPGRTSSTSSNTWILEKWQEEYRDLMDRWKDFMGRSRFDVGRVRERRRLGESGWADRLVNLQSLVVCPVCHNLLTKQTEEHLYRKGVLRGTIQQTTVRTNICLYCNNALPRCVICLLHVLPHNLEPTDGYGDKDPEIEDTIDSAYVCCQTCRHGGHANHILPWFEGGLDGEPPHDVCAVSGCSCECGSI